MPTVAAVSTTRYDELIALLDSHRARYRILEHAPEGRTHLVSAMRGHAPGEAAKCMIVMVKRGKRDRRYVRAVVPGDARVDLTRLRELLGGTYAAFASAEVAEQVAGSPVGTVLPFTFDDRVELIADPALLASSTLYFNAGRLDRSIALDAGDYTRVAKPRLAPIAEPR